MDRYYEQLTKVYKSGLYSLYTTLMVLTALMFLGTMSSFFPFSLIFGGLAVLFYYLRQREYIEYEYIFTNGDIDIDMIIETQKRKNVINFDMKDVEILAPAGSTYLDGAPKGKKVTAYPKNSKDQVFVAIVNKENTVHEIYFTPNEDFINMCFRSNPKNVKRS